jgi:predicted O-methyltransferase YrrM
MMFNTPPVQAVFAEYEARAAADMERIRALGPAGYAIRDEFLLPVGADAGRLIHAMILGAKPKVIVEVGTSYGYSTLFLADAAKAVGAQIISLEIADYKQAFAADMMARAGLSDVVEFQCGNAVELLGEISTMDFVLLDIWKDLYIPCLHAMLPRLADGAMVLADNMLSPEIEREQANKYRAEVAGVTGMSTVLLPIGSGMELSVWGHPAPT